MKTEIGRMINLLSENSFWFRLLVIHSKCVDELSISIMRSMLIHLIWIIGLEVDQARKRDITFFFYYQMEL